MRVHLIKTPELVIENFRDVCDFLNSFEGVLEFIPSEYKLDYDIGNPLSKEKLFSLCNIYREVNDIKKNDFVVLLTNLTNEDEWFSAFDDLKNIFVHTDEWELYTKVNSKYPISYQVVENIIQSMMNIDILNVPNTYVHEPSRGCMNDFCDNKHLIINKLQTANICPTCIKKIYEQEIDTEILQQASTIFDVIREEFKFKIKKKSIEPSKLTVDRQGKIHLPDYNLEIRLTPLFKTLYIFYLNHGEGIRFNELNDFKDELLRIYRKLSVSTVEDANSVLETSITDLVNPIGNSFNEKKSKINKIISDLLGEPLAQFYRIEGQRNEPFRISISSSKLIRIDF